MGSWTMEEAQRVRQMLTLVGQCERLEAMVLSSAPVALIYEEVRACTGADVLEIRHWINYILDQKGKL